MQPVSQHISRLLYAHNCVIVPGLGGFVLNYQSARMHPMTYQFNSPSKSIAFNVNLKNNDGLLYSSISTEDHVTLREAEQSVRLFVDDILGNLNEKKPVKLQGIGRLMTDIENNIQFIPDISNNYLLQAYGLYSLTAEPILREKQAAIRHIETKKLKPRAKKKKAYRILLPIAAVLLVLFTAGQLIFQTQVKGLNYSEVLGTDKIFHHEVINASEFQGNTKTFQRIEFFSGHPVMIDTTQAQIPDAAVINTIQNNISADNSAIQTAVQEHAPGYLIIGGVFGREQYAQNVIGAISQKGVSGWVLKKNNRYMVAVDLQSGLSPAEGRKQFISATGITDAWVMKYK